MLTDRAHLQRRMTAQFHTLLGEVLDAVEAAPDSRRTIMIEIAFHDALMNLMTESLRAAHRAAHTPAFRVSTIN